MRDGIPLYVAAVGAAVILFITGLYIAMLSSVVAEQKRQMQQLRNAYSTVMDSASRSNDALYKCREGRSE